MSQEILILGARRTPIGAFQGALAPLAGHQLGAIAARAAVADAGIDAALLDEAVFGCVLPAGQGQAPARQAAIGAGIPASVPATTVNKMCGSGMKAVMIGADQIPHRCSSRTRSTSCWCRPTASTITWALMA